MPKPHDQRPVTALTTALPPAATSRRAWLQQAAATSASACAGGLATWAPAARAQLPVQEDPDTNRVWLAVRSSLFGDRSIQVASPAQLVLEVAARAVDAAVVPIALRCRLPANTPRQVSRLLLVIDSNPSPIGMRIQFSAASGPADIETRVRVDAYSHVRAIAELSDGTLWMRTRYVKASGGCSAPAAGDAATALARLGQIRLQPEAAPPAGEAQAVQLHISHPNHSGLAMDQYTRQNITAHYVRQIDITLAGRPVLQADVDFSLSENPYLRFFVQPGDGGELLAGVVDSDDRRFSASRTLLRATA